MDYAKDFNKVNHSPLTHKLYHCIITEQINMWISSFLTGQQQVAVVKDTKSDYTDVNSGVPQVSVLGSCLFLTRQGNLPSSYLLIYNTMLSRLWHPKTTTAPTRRSRKFSNKNHNAFFLFFPPSPRPIWDWNNHSLSSPPPPPPSPRPTPCRQEPAPDKQTYSIFPYNPPKWYNVQYSDNRHSKEDEENKNLTEVYNTNTALAQHFVSCQCHELRMFLAM